jgi:hypothetical protein
VDSGRGGLRPRLQHIITFVIYTYSKIPSSDSAGKGVIGIFAILSRLSFVCGGTPGASTRYAGWKQER